LQGLEIEALFIDEPPDVDCMATGQNRMMLFALVPHQ
jgi:hypothetical protein